MGIVQVEVVCEAEHSVEDVAVRARREEEEEEEDEGSIRRASVWFRLAIIERQLYGTVSNHSGGIILHHTSWWVMYLSQLHHL